MLREKTQRRLFRVLFTLGCLVPTLLVSAWAVARYTPIYKMIALSVINEATGLQVTCQQLETPRPNEYKLTAVEILDPVTERLLAKVDRLIVRQTEGQQSSGQWEAIVGEAWIAQPTQSTEERFPLRLTDYHEIVRCSFESITVDDPGNTWRGVQLEFSPALEEEPAKLIVTSSESDTRFKVVQQLVKHSVKTDVQLETGTQPLPLDLLPLGDEYQTSIMGGSFTGYAELSFDGKKNTGMIQQGHIRLSEGNYSFGNDSIEWNSADIEIAKLRWFNNKIIHFQASISADDGLLSRNTIWGLNQHLQCIPTDQLNSIWEVNLDKPISYEKLDCQIGFNILGLTLKTDNPEGALLSLNENPLLLVPTKDRIPLWSVVRAFFPNTAQLVPNDPAALKMVQALPFQKTQ